MTTLDPEQLLSQGDRLIASQPTGRPRQVDLRRAISAAYYAVFHATLSMGADHFVGVAKRATTGYGLVYRSVDHRSLRDLCSEMKKQTLPSRYARHQPPGGFGPDLKAFAAGLLELQEMRHAADYDPLVRAKRSDAVLAVGTARRILDRFRNASAAQRAAFLTLLLFPPR